MEKRAEKEIQITKKTTAEKETVKEGDQLPVDAELRTRPEEWLGATKVSFLVFIVDIDNIDNAKQSFSANIFTRLRWQDPRLAKPGSGERQMLLDSIWNPRVLLANQAGLVQKSLPDIVQVYEDGTVIYYQLYTGHLSQRLYLPDFPMDQHSFFVQFVAAGYDDTQINFIPDSLPSRPDIRGGSMANDLSLPDWKIPGFEALKLSYSPIDGVHIAGFGTRFKAKRYISYYIWQLVLPLMVVVMMSWVAFWIGRDENEVRLAVATSAVLTLIANRFVLAALLPHLPYMTRMDYLTVGSTLLVLLSLLMVVLISYLEKKQKYRLSKILDIWSRGVFPLSFLSLLGWFLFGYN